MLFALCFLILFLCNAIQAAGKVIAFSGISGSGKSTLAQLISQKLSAQCVVEPEESEWPAIIKNRDLYGHATAMLAFRQLWAQQFVDAHTLSQTHNLVFIDTYFFKINGYYLNKPGMAWLVPCDDPYMSLLIKLNELDQNY